MSGARDPRADPQPGDRLRTASGRYEIEVTTNPAFSLGEITWIADHPRWGRFQNQCHLRQWHETMIGATVLTVADSPALGAVVGRGA